MLGRAEDADVLALLAAQGWDPVVVAGDDPGTVFTDLRRELAAAHARIRAIQQAAQQGAAADAMPTGDRVVGAAAPPAADTLGLNQQPEVTLGDPCGDRPAQQVDDVEVVLSGHGSGDTDRYHPDRPG